MLKFKQILCSILILLCLFSFSSVWAQNVKRVNVVAGQVTLNQLIQEIEKQTDYTFVFDNSIELSQKVTLKSGQEDVDVLLKQAFAGKDLIFEILGKQIILKKNVVAPKADKQITGTVKDELGEAVIGASLKMKKTSIGTITDMNGDFHLTVPENTVIEISFVGYNTQVLKVDNRINYNITLKENVKLLQEVVVTALGVKREEKALGYATQKVVGESLTTVKGIDIATSLTGKVSGMMVKNSTEFATTPTLEIRGESPIIVIDNVPYANVSLSEIAADDIKEITVLKGATASALYGFRGANGAVLITTKSGNGNLDKGLSVSINSSTMFTAGYLAIPEQQSVFGRYLNTVTNKVSTGGDGSWGIQMDGRKVIQWDPVTKSEQLMEYLPRGKKNFKNFLEQGYILNNNVSISQQGEHAGIRTSLSWIDNKGQYPNSTLDKYSFSVGGNINIEKFVLNSTFNYNKQKSPNIGFNGYTGYDPMYNLLIWSTPDYNILDYKDYWVIPDEQQNTSYTDTNNNPYFDRYERTHSLDKDVFNASLSMEYKIAPWLKATLRGGFDSYSNKQEIKISVGSLISAGSATIIQNGTQVWGESKLGSYNIGLSRGYSLNGDFILSANYIYKDFTVDGLLGGTMYYTQDEGIEAFTKGGLSIPGYYSLNASVNNKAVNSNIYKQQVNSLFARFAASWKNMLYLEATLRNDWSSTLPSSTRSYLYPSVSGSFIVSELLPKWDWLSMWKLRSSWTKSKTPADIYSTNLVYSIENSAWNNFNSATLPSTVKDSYVKPESSSTIEFGTMISLFNNKLSLDASYYQKKMYDFLTEASVSSASGYDSRYINTNEEITRKGVEIAAKATPVRTKDWTLNVNLNWSKYARYYTKLDPVYSSNNPWVYKGARVDTYTLYDFEKDSQGNIIFSNGLPTYSDYLSVQGYSDPDWIWGLSTDLIYKNLKLSISIDGRVGGLAQTYTEMYMWRSGNHPNSVVPERYVESEEGGSHYIGKGVKAISGSAEYDTFGNIISDNRVYQTNDVATTYESYINKIHKGTAWGGAPSPLDLYSTTFFKIREISLSYDLPKKWCKAVCSNKITVSAIGQNVFLWAKQFKYSDPDGGVENFADPSQRYLGFNIKIDL